MSSPMQGSLAPWMQGAVAAGEGTSRDRAAGPGGAVGIVERRALEAVERGDLRAALTLLMDAYGEDIYKFCRQLTSDGHLAEDLRQVVFIQAFEQLVDFEPRSTLRAWLYGIARHRCLDACKSQRRWRKRVQCIDAAAESVAGEPQDMAGAIDQATIERALTHCLGKLDIELRMLILMRYRDGLSYTELAEAFHARPATLQARVARIIPRLRRCVQRQGVIP
jgi:RNA polymerase sigma factor (sigma-70 family)